MKAHKYRMPVVLAVYGDYPVNAILTGILIPEEGIIGYILKDRPFFKDEVEDIAEARAVIESRREGEYVGEIDLSDEDVLKAVSAAKALTLAEVELERAEKEWKKSSLSLLEKIID